MYFLFTEQDTLPCNPLVPVSQREWTKPSLMVHKYVNCSMHSAYIRTELPFGMHFCHDPILRAEITRKARATAPGMLRGRIIVPVITE